MVNINEKFWRNRVVFITGHTGFKGGWLSLWLHGLEAKIHGFALNPPTKPSLFEEAQIKNFLSSDIRSDISDLHRLKAAFLKVKPEIVFHLAAQPLVRESYRDPIDTFLDNVMGTAHLLEAARNAESVRAIVVVTSDKVYQNRDSDQPFRENDPLGGSDPYSASKAAAEIVTASYQQSFFGNDSERPVKLATARAGNVIGGGDWAHDRLVPDCLNAFSNGEAVYLRYPTAVRPWQHVLEPISGYLTLANRLFNLSCDDSLPSAFNFGPEASGNATVEQVAKMIAKIWGDKASVIHKPSDTNPPETGILRLSSELARKVLEWQPSWSMEQALKKTVEWYQGWQRGDDMAQLSLNQIHEYGSGSFFRK